MLPKAPSACQAQDIQGCERNAFHNDPNFLMSAFCFPRHPLRVELSFNAKWQTGRQLISGGDDFPLELDPSTVIFVV